MNFEYFDKCMKSWKQPKNCVSYDSLSMKDKRKLYRIVKINLEIKQKK